MLENEWLYMHMQYVMNEWHCIAQHIISCGIYFTRELAEVHFQLKLFTKRSLLGLKQLHK